MKTPTLSMADVPVALLAGGLATRLAGVARHVPKALVEVAGRPFVEHQIELLRRNGARKIVFCVGHLGDRIEAALGDGSSWGMEFVYSHDGAAPLGTGGALRQALPHLGEVFWVAYGDSYMDVDYRAILAHFAASRSMGLMTVLRNEGRWDASNAVYADDWLVSYDKKNRTPAMQYIDYGLQLLCRAALGRVPKGVAYDVADVYRDLVAGGAMAGYEVRERFYEIGTPASLEETRAFLAGRAPHRVFSRAG